METLSAFDNPRQWTSLVSGDEVQCLSATEWDRLSPDGHIVLHRDRRVLARCSFWARSLPNWKGKSTGAIGHFDAVDPASGKKVVERATERLKAQGVELAIGPIHANTWNPYRLITRSDGRPPFLMEPAHPLFYTELWRDMGFQSVADYFSAEVPLELETDPRLERTIHRLRESGVSIRALNTCDFENDLKQIHSVSCKAFAENFFYTDIGEEEFMALYAPYRDNLDPRLVFIAEKRGDVVGFLFGVPDFLQASRGENVDTVVYKTVAVLPKRELAGLGLWLSHCGHRVAADLGYRRIIHALVTSQSRLGSLNWTDVDVFREYSLMGKEL